MHLCNLSKMVKMNYTREIIYDILFQLKIAAWINLCFDSLSLCSRAVLSYLTEVTMCLIAWMFLHVINHFEVFLLDDESTDLAGRRWGRALWPPVWRCWTHCWRPERPVQLPLPWPSSGASCAGQMQHNSNIVLQQSSRCFVLLLVVWVIIWKSYF